MDRSLEIRVCFFYLLTKEYGSFSIGTEMHKIGFRQKIIKTFGAGGLEFRLVDK